MTGFEWPKLMRAGLRDLGLKPDEFWALSPAELALMLGVGSVAPPLSRAGLAALQAAYPDQNKEQENDEQ